MRPKGKGKGKGGKSRQWRNPSGFAFHASEEMFNAMEESCGYTAGEYYANTHGDDDYSEDYAEAYNADEDEYEDSYPGYDTSGDWNDEGMEAYVAEEWSKKWSVDNPVEACELETVAYIVQTIGEHCTQDPELCSGIIQDHTALVAKGGKGKGKGNKSGKYPIRPSNLALEDRRKMLAELKAKTPCKDCGRKGHWRGDKECTMRRNTPFERRANVAVKFCESYSTSRCTSGSTSTRFFEAGDSLEDADRCGYMVVEEDADEPTSDDQEENFLEGLPINAGRFWLPDTLEDLKYDQMTQLSIFVRRWRQLTAGNKMIRQMRKAKGEMALIPMDAATKKVVWRAAATAVQRVQATPDPMSLMPHGESHSALHLYSLIPEFVGRWFQIMEENRPLRQAEQAEKAAHELLLEECREEVKKIKKERNKAASTKKGMKSTQILAKQEDSEEEAIVEDGFSSSSHSNDSEEVNSMKAEASRFDSDEDFNDADASNKDSDVNSPILARVRASGHPGASEAVSYGRCGAFGLFGHSARGVA